jgi:hypothetical protein
MAKVWNNVPVTVNFDGVPIGVASVYQSPEGLMINFVIRDPEWVDKLSIPESAEHPSYSLAGVSYMNPVSKLQEMGYIGGQQTPRRSDGASKTE